jgi:hypothetical protein
MHRLVDRALGKAIQGNPAEEGNLVEVRIQPQVGIRAADTEVEDKRVAAVYIWREVLMPLVSGTNYAHNENNVSLFQHRWQLNRLRNASNN